MNDDRYWTSTSLPVKEDLAYNVSFCDGSLLLDFKRDGVLYVQAVRAGIRGERKCSAKEGDANADGTTDISDALTILGYLFQGSPKELPPLCSSRADNPGLPDTGQVTCADEEGLDIPCNSDTCPGQDTFYATGCESEARFVDNGDGTVTDNCTRLIWEKRTADTNGDGKINGSDKVVWCEALVYCENLSLAGHDDWRLPNVRELQSIVDYGNVLPTIAVPTFRAFTESYWSSTTLHFIHPEDAYAVSFNDGTLSPGGKHSLFHVRAVRTAP